MSYTQAEFWEGIGAPGPAPAQGLVFGDAPLLVAQPDRFRPIVAPDEEGNQRLYLPAKPDYALVMTRHSEAVWLAPILVSENFENPETFRQLLERGWDPVRCEGWLSLPPPPLVQPPFEALAVLIFPTVIQQHLLELLRPTPLCMMTALARREHLEPALRAMGH